RSAEVEAEHAADRLRRELHVRSARLRREALDEGSRGALQLFLKAGLLDKLERREAGGDCDRIARERPGLVHRTERRDFLHDVAAAAESDDRQPAADPLAARRV